MDSPLLVPTFILNTSQQSLCSLSRLPDSVVFGIPPLGNQVKRPSWPDSRHKVLMLQPDTCSAVPQVMLNGRSRFSCDERDIARSLRRVQRQEDLQDPNFLTVPQTRRRSRRRSSQTEPKTLTAANITDIPGKVASTPKLSSSEPLTPPGQTSILSIPLRPHRESLPAVCTDTPKRKVHRLKRFTPSPSTNTIQWNLTYFPSIHKLWNRSPFDLQPIPIHKKKGKLSARTIRGVQHELHQSGIQPSGFHLEIPRYHEEIEVQFRLLMIRNQWDSWPASLQQDMHVWPVTKKWLLIHQRELLIWAKEQTKDLPRPCAPESESEVLSRVPDVECFAVSRTTVAGNHVVRPAIRTAYHYLRRNLPRGCGL